MGSQNLDLGTLRAMLEEFNVANQLEHASLRAFRRAAGNDEERALYAAWHDAALARWYTLYEELSPFAWRWNRELARYELE